MKKTGERRRLRILVVVASISRAGAGVAQSARLFAQAASGRSAEIEVMTSEDPFYREDVRSWMPLLVRAFPVIGPTRYGFSPGFLFALLRSDADIAHVHGVWTFHCLAVHLWALLKRRPYVVTPHGMLEAWIRKRSPVLKRIVSFLYQDRFLRRASLLHLLTEQERVDVADFASGGRVRIVPNYVEPFEPPGGPPGWWNGAFKGRDVYLFFGRIHEKKGCMELCAAWDRLCSGDVSFRDRSVLVFGGWVDGLQGFEDRVAELHARHGNVVFAGPQYGEDRDRSFAAASFFLLPSKSEGLPMSVLEAWAAGKPVLMTAACNLPIGFDVGAALQIGLDEADIRGGLTAASSMTTERRLEMALAARTLIADRYSVRTVAAEMLALYRDALTQ
jgi:glycosyltransferase involved in cell wall biosynthesis